jgi:predicted RNA-binding protein with TRAM domain
MLLLASQGTCDEDETHPDAVSPGESVDVCIYLFGAEGDASIADIRTFTIF